MPPLHSSEMAFGSGKGAQLASTYLSGKLSGKLTSGMDLKEDALPLR